MEISTKLKCFYHLHAVGHMSEDSQFKLTIIGNNEFATLIGNKRFPDFVLIFIQCWLVLKVGFTTGKTSRFCVKVHTAMDTTFGIWCSLKWYYIGLKQGFDLLKLQPIGEGNTGFNTFLLFAKALKVVVSKPIFACIRITCEYFDCRAICRRHTAGCIVNWGYTEPLDFHQSVLKWLCLAFLYETL